MLTDASIAVFRTPEACADAVRAYFSWQAPVDDAVSLLPDHDAFAALAREAVASGDATKLLDRSESNRRERPTSQSMRAKPKS